MAGTNAKRWLQIDALRAFAVLSVVWSHTSNREIGITGFDGVLLFFVISGFLITHILLEARGAAQWSMVLRAFYARRFLRIFPLYYGVLLFGAAIDIPNLRSAFGWHVTYLSNWFYSSRGMLDQSGHQWSLAVEEQFYLFWPAFALLLLEKALTWALGAMILAGPASRFALGAAGINNLAVWISTPSVLDALGLGCLLAYLWRDTRKADRWATWALVLGLLLIAVRMAAIETAWASNPVVELAINTLGWRILCFWLVHRAARGIPGPLGRLLLLRPLIFVGTVSYGIYLIHPYVIPALSIFERHFHFRSPVPMYPGLRQFSSVTVISIVAAGLSWRLYELPINSLKRYFPYVPSARPGADGGTSARPADNGGVEFAEAKSTVTENAETRD